MFSQLKPHFLQCKEFTDTFIKPTLGPCGISIYLPSENLFTNDGCEIIQRLVHQPKYDGIGAILRLLSFQIKSQDENVGDGTTTTMILASELIQQKAPFTYGVLSKAYRKCLDICLCELKKIRIHQSAKGHEDLKNVLKTCLSSKILDKDIFVNMLIDIGQKIITEKKDISSQEFIKLVKVVGKTGKSYQQSQMIQGLVFEDCRLPIYSQEKSFTNPSILLCRLTELSTSATGKLALETMRKTCDFIISKKITLVFLAGKCHPEAEFKLAKNHCFVITLPLKRLQEIANLYDIEICFDVTFSNIEPISIPCTITERFIADVPVLIMSSSEFLYHTILLRAPMHSLLQEYERSLHDAICICYQSLSNDYIVGGGGSVYMRLRQAIQESSQFSDQEKHFADHYCDSLEQIPRTLLRNAGYLELEYIQMLKRCHQQRKEWIGIDLDSGQMIDMVQKGIVEPSSVISSVLTNATDVSLSILQISKHYIMKPISS